MQLEHSFSVPVDADEAWKTLLDLEMVATCFPGATLDAIEGDTFTGVVKVKLGPIALTYRGTARFISLDEEARVAVLDARGRETKGAGTATAMVTARLFPEGEATRVELLTDMDVTGKPAQFGRGMMTEVSNKILGQFALRLAERLSGANDAGDAAVAGSAASAKAGSDDALNLVGAAWKAVAKRLLPVAALAVVGVVALRVARKRARSR